MTHANASIVILTGAGISAESGVPTFRANDGLWCGHRVEDVATPEAFARQPDVVQDFYNQRRRQLGEVEPNAAHHALALLAKHWRGDVTIITQNVDDLHDRALEEAGCDVAKHLVHMHGELKKARCLHCGDIGHWYDDLSDVDSCGICEVQGGLRPHIVWFGEMPLQMEHCESVLADADMFLSIGTSGQVYPAAGFVQIAHAYGAECIEMNLEPTGQNQLFHKHEYGPATQIVNAWVNGLLNSL